MAAGRAAEELVYGPDEMSTINQRRLVMARRIVQKLVLTLILHPNLNPPMSTWQNSPCLCFSCTQNHTSGCMSCSDASQTPYCTDACPSTVVACVTACLERRSLSAKLLW